MSSRTLKNRHESDRIHSFHPEGIQSFRELSYFSVIHVERKKERKEREKNEASSKKRDGESWRRKWDARACRCLGNVYQCLSRLVRLSPARAFYFRSTRGKRFPPQRYLSRVTRVSWFARPGQVESGKSGCRFASAGRNRFRENELITIDFLFVLFFAENFLPR